MNNGKDNPYLYNAKELDEETGFYYYGQRYYDPRISNWISVDELALYDPIQNKEHYLDAQHKGGAFNSKNLGVYNYSYQNPIVYTDPDGNQSLSDWIHGGLDVIGLIPVVGEVADGINAIYYLAEGDYVNAGISAASMIPIVGDAAKGGKYAVKAINAIDVANDGRKALDRANDSRKALEAASSGRRFWTKTTTFDGVKVYQRSDIFDPKTISTWKENGKTITGTNLERMASGRAPVGVDGKSVNLHHMTQSNNSGIAEMTQTFHKENHDFC